MTALPDPDLRPEFYAGVPTKRLLAWLVDMIVIAAMSLLIVVLTVFTGLLFFSFLMFVTGFIYRVITIANGSATWGMRLMAIELRDRRDQPFDLSLAFLHTLGYSLSFGVTLVQLVSVVLMATTASGKGLTDLVIGSAALNRRRR